MFKNIIYLLIGLGILILYIRYTEYKATYFPTKALDVFPDSIGLAYEDAYFETNDGKKLNGWFLPCENSKFTLLFCHGNGGNISHRLEKLLILHELGLDIFIFDYRGYGKSQGRPSEKGLYSDIRAAYNYLVSVRKIEPERIIVYGESLGGAVAIDLASKEKLRALITEETFTSARDMAKLTFPLLPSFLISTRFDSLDKIRKISVPKLIIHSINDEIVPFKLAEKMFNAAKDPKQFLKLTGSHNTAFLDSEDLYRSGISEFLTTSW